MLFRSWVLGIEFVSLSESLDTATPAGRMVFTVLGAVAELERSLIAERVRAGLRNARAKGAGRGSQVDAPALVRLRAEGRSCVRGMPSSEAEPEAPISRH